MGPAVGTEPAMRQVLNCATYRLVCDTASPIANDHVERGPVSHRSADLMENPMHAATRPATIWRSAAARSAVSSIALSRACGFGMPRGPFRWKRYMWLATLSFAISEHAKDGVEIVVVFARNGVPNRANLVDECIMAHESSSRRSSSSNRSRRDHHSRVTC
jgi:hypothetical protein